jgi:hypothetical protein
MATSPNKGYELQVTGTNVDTWGDVLNNDVFTIIDNNLGGVVTKSLTNIQVNLDADESQMLRLVLNGTLTGNVLVTTQAIGMTIVDNQCTGSFSVTFQKNGVGAAIPIPNGTVNLVTTGASGNPRNVAVEFPTGTRLPFQQTTPPAGYSKDTTTSGLNNSAVRLVTGSVVNGAGGDFTAINASRGLSGSVGNTTLTIAQMPLHGHPYRYSTSSSEPEGTGGFTTDSVGQFTGGPFTGSPTGTNGQQIGGEGGGQSHGHSLSINNLDMAVRYFDFTIGVRI